MVLTHRLRIDSPNEWTAIFNISGRTGPATLAPITEWAFSLSFQEDGGGGCATYEEAFDRLGLMLPIIKRLLQERKKLSVSSASLLCKMVWVVDKVAIPCWTSRRQYDKRGGRLRRKKESRQKKPSKQNCPSGKKTSRNPQPSSVKLSTAAKRMICMWRMTILMFWPA